jgi:hypothetical protein
MAATGTREITIVFVLLIAFVTFAKEQKGSLHVIEVHPRDLLTRNQSVPLSSIAVHEDEDQLILSFQVSPNVDDAQQRHNSCFESWPVDDEEKKGRGAWCDSGKTATSFFTEGASAAGIDAVHIEIMEAAPFCSLSSEIIDFTNSTWSTLHGGNFVFFSFSLLIISQHVLKSMTFTSI